MAVRLAALLPRLIVVTLVWLFATATLTFAAEKHLAATTPSKPAAPVAKPELVVPDIRNQAFVFAKGLLSDAGFAWKVSGSVQGYATNVVLSQSPAPGTHVVDTGAPTITIRLARGRYGEHGTPENASTYAGTAIVLPRAAVPAKPVRRATKPKVAAKPKVVARPKAAAKPKAKAKPTRAAAAKKRVRRPDFIVSNAPREPQDEMSLPARAQLLDKWLTPSRSMSNANARHWLYQHAWIVTGAKFGWWHGAEALRTLIAVDRRVEAQWGIGGRSEAVARATLARVEARAR
jgi:hypothetical protein